MFCKNCGKEINDNAVVCPHCGVQVAQVQINNSNSDNSNGIAVVGFVFAFLFSLVGLICSCIGYKRAKNEGLDHKGLAVAGIVISAIGLGFWVLLFTILGVGGCAACAAFAGSAAL